ncbi:MAG: cupin domain-containing protein [Immundisolibacterales bacterium]|nr:cupin domain-containing protein [Immundisolibacterales bacterium]
MNPIESARGRAVVVQPDEGCSWWQPLPANGHADPKLVPADTGFATLSMGYQTIAPGSRIRPHSHGDQVELQICFRGRGHAIADGERHPLVPGTACFLGPDVKHEIVNESAVEDLVMMWLISPAGLEDFFRAIGRERTPEEPAPAPFERPSEVVAIERDLGMNDTTAGGR